MPKTYCSVEQCKVQNRAYVTILYCITAWVCLSVWGGEEGTLKGFVRNW